MREVTRFGPCSDLLRAVGQTYFMQYARKHLATPTVGDLNFVYTPQGTPSDPQSITFTCAPPHTSAHSRYRSHQYAIHTAPYPRPATDTQLSRGTKAVGLEPAGAHTRRAAALSSLRGALLCEAKRVKVSGAWIVCVHAPDDCLSSWAAQRAKWEQSGSASVSKTLHERREL